MSTQSGVNLDSLIDNIARIAKFPKEEVKMDFRLYNSRVVSSLSMLEIMSFVEKEYGIVILPEEMIEDNFGDIGKLKEMIDRKLA
ncbi:acyl carrier protein [Anaerobacterium chartisolvens]|uniref:Acyl carrier protein n=1 Tax=Anaerobacterium chartisolvens TaxID=1297424 RepID=A0A369B6Y3_9FIRM|nr:acyl carrier protein [Anaerobacterium chartisolvens]RCX16306.1 acyl carrier protein [Anaerobacterium chartisolvens]